MKYTKELNNYEKALGLTEEQEIRIKTAIQHAYNQKWHEDGPNVDQIIALVAPHIQTPEEGFYTASIILSDIFESMK